MHIADIRKDYRLQTLDEAGVAADPIQQFGIWWQEALQSEIVEVNAMTLATANEQGVPSARIVLLKGYDERGFVFFSNYESKKAGDLQVNPMASLVFFWKELERQVRISGRVEKVTELESDQYFQSRPEGSRIGAWASPQSTVISSRQVIEEKVEALQASFAGKEIPRPLHWGGYRVVPSSIEFWQGRSSRLHDRIQYTLQSDDNWVIERLAP
ncbi:MAG: pyridoxamine 5'-phosphate oxidase [Chitinophagaceae bacterium]|jgi:pyridoxamine 5'-phosphate oxidase|nr:pyridoxamine 5'-phosphate oxidase [Chitinophagaceae bacterium]MCA6468368.1 pyridoxamine 5'-phosphate oxidase [Chitinophagaceae bacterium]MCA6478614.1 pyridoxamine 5'-phosphate oxidase [Chitinophagaceae bacterium]MCA6479091.1 pyridoxamine 5'-phosphate oxidase [Chitinophagaceae bacterium]MCA6481569.1 pyridoxamine 5'-phosphate oxidase [Chitinophagaceae bacterium]